MGVSEQLARMLERSGMAQAELARRLGVRRSWVNRRVTGTVAVSADELPDLARVLGVSILEFYPEGSDSPGPPTSDLVARELMKGLGTGGVLEARFAAALAELLRSYKEGGDTRDP